MHTITHGIPNQCTAHLRHLIRPRIMKTRQSVAETYSKISIFSGIQPHAEHMCDNMKRLD